MTQQQHLTELLGLPVVDFADVSAKGDLPAADSVAWRVGVDPYDDEGGEDFEERWRRFLGTVDPAGVRAVVIGQWGEPYDNDSGEVVSLLVGARDRLTGLRAVFLADLEMEEAEISWIEQSDVTPVLEAYPALEEFGVRGGSGLRFPAVRHEALRRLWFETGGLPGEVVRGVGACTLPALEYLEMWLGVSDYGGDAGVADLAPLLEGGRFPRLRHLGLQDSEIQDEIAAAVASAPVVAQLRSLSLSMGVLTDAGAEALLTGQPLTHLAELDLHHHYLSEPMMQRLREALEPAGVRVDLSECEEPESDGDDGTVWRYVAVSE
ncbi:MULTISPECIES: STM4015 family protein [Streptomyces]|uniref:STM4015 family protein n=1 Tax=Streptomyces TaxID=1883 RepID=UPI000CAEB17F|nr:STM4015 family protein [Streptomyces sp. HB2AG]MCZ2525324.1 STM4015 family protein [Streptomyces sp. HB2AG]PLW74097.1 cytoplasmic protein [Streptomyces sp. DJ]